MRHRLRFHSWKHLRHHLLVPSAGGAKPGWVPLLLATSFATISESLFPRLRNCYQGLIQQTPFGSITNWKETSR